MIEGKKVMTDAAKIFVDESRAFLMADYLPKIERCLEALTDEDIWWRPNEESNSIGNLLLHLEGSTRGWIVNTAGGGDNPRDRQQEFDEREHIPASELLARLKRTLAQADEVLARLSADELLERRKSAYEEVTVFWAVYHAVEHFAMHTGQIIMLAKMRAKPLQFTN
jgi:uncharacterized damage-inducible protein DinB